MSARDAGDFSDAAGEREIAPKCGSLPRDAGDLVGLKMHESVVKWSKPLFRAIYRIVRRQDVV